MLWLIFCLFCLFFGWNDDVSFREDFFVEIDLPVASCDSLVSLITANLKSSIDLSSAKEEFDVGIPAMLFAFASNVSSTSTFLKPCYDSLRSDGSCDVDSLAFSFDVLKKHYAGVLELSDGLLDMLVEDHRNFIAYNELGLQNADAVLSLIVLRFVADPAFYVIDPNFSVTLLSIRKLYESVVFSWHVVMDARQKLFDSRKNYLNELSSMYTSSTAFFTSYVNSGVGSSDDLLALRSSTGMAKFFLDSSPGLDRSLKDFEVTYENSLRSFFAALYPFSVVIRNDTLIYESFFSSSS